MPYIYNEGVYTKKELEVILLKKGYSIADADIIISSCEKIPEDIKKRERGKDRFKTLQFRVTDEEYIKAHTKAKEMKLSLSDYFRELINKEG